MQTILIATDFSPAARSAALYGLQLARAFNAKLILAGAFEQVPIPVSETPMIAEPEDMVFLVRRQLVVEAAALTTDNPYPIECVTCEGATTPAILRVARNRNADLIVVGMKGNGKDVRRLFGSTVTGLARKTSIPLLIIPETAHFTPPKAIGFASNVFDETDFSVPAIVKQLADRFHSQLFIIRLFNKHSGEVIEILHLSLTGNRTIGAFTALYELPADESVADRLNEYISASPVDLLVMKPHPRTLPERWFLRSNTRRMIFKTDVPLLVLPGGRSQIHES